MRELIKHPKLAGALLIFLVVFLSYGQTLMMYIWQDDHAVMFKLQHLEESAGHFGRGFYDQSSIYRGVLVPLVPIYHFFGTHPAPYYAAGILAYFLAALSVYLFVWTLTKNKRIGFAASLIFASGFIGSESLWRIFNSIHTSHTVIAICLTLILYKKFIDSKKDLILRRAFFYLASLILFIYSMETGFVRAHGIILLILSLELFWNFNFLTILKSAPFIYFYHSFYLTSSISQGELASLLNKILVEQKLELLLVPLKNLQNIILPSNFGIPFFLFLSFLFIILWKVRAKILWFSIIFMLANYAVYFIHTPTITLPSLHRYFLISLIGFCIFATVVLHHFFRSSKQFFLAIIFIVLIHLFLVNKEQLQFINDISNPSKKFYKTLLQEIPDMERDSAIYFDMRDDEKSTKEFANFFGVGSMPNTTAVAWHYGIDRGEIFLPDTFGEMVTLLKNNKTTASRIYTFYYETDHGLTNTTQATRQFLLGSASKVLVDDISNINFKFSSPIEISLNLSSEIDWGKLSNRPEATKLIPLAFYLDYLQSRHRYYKLVQAVALSEWKDQKITNIIDEDVATSWAGDRLKWHYEHSESITLDLGEKRTIGTVKLNYNSNLLVPIQYTYFCSLDNVTWTKLRHTSQVPFIETRSSGMIIDKLTTSDCQFVKMQINMTPSNDSPKISEMEIIEEKFTNINFLKADQFEDDPFKFVSSLKDLEILIPYIERNEVSTTVCLKTNKSEKPYCQKVKIIPNLQQTYFLTFGPNGTILESAEIYAPFGVNITLEKLWISTIPFNELKNRI